MIIRVMIESQLGIGRALPPPGVAAGPLNPVSTLSGITAQSTLAGLVSPTHVPHRESGLLGKDMAGQTPEAFDIFRSYVAIYRSIFSLALPTQRLALLKQQTFTAEGRATRIAQSLAALNAEPPATLRAEEWKRLIEEIEAED